MNRGIVTATKTGRARVVPLGPQLIAVLRELRPANDFVFTYPTTGTYPRPHYTDKILRRFCQEAGTRVVSWKDLRHTCATRLTSSGAPIRVVQELLGHSTIAMTSRYAHVTPSALWAWVRSVENPTVPDAVGPLMVTKHADGNPVDTSRVGARHASSLS